MARVIFRAALLLAVGILLIQAAQAKEADSPEESGKRDPRSLFTTLFKVFVPSFKPLLSELSKVASSSSTPGTAGDSSAAGETSQPTADPLGPGARRGPGSEGGYTGDDAGDEFVDPLVGLLVLALLILLPLFLAGAYLHGHRQALALPPLLPPPSRVLHRAALALRRSLEGFRPAASVPPRRTGGESAADDTLRLANLLLRAEEAYLAGHISASHYHSIIQRCDVLLAAIHTLRGTGAAPPRAPPAVRRERLPRRGMAGLRLSARYKPGSPVSPGN